jgi:hypothetical protein
MSPTIGRIDTNITRAKELLLVDNSQYLERVNQAELQKQFVVTTTTVVLNQDPAPGTQVPVGTQINLTLVNKGDFPTSSLGVSAAVGKKWTRAGDVITAVEGAGSGLKAILDKGDPYEKLDQGDKAVVDGFFRQQIGDADIASAYADVGFIYEL